MAITLGGVTLSPSLQWIDRYRTTNVAQETKRTLAGTLVERSVTLNGGKPITLVATEDTGWFTKSMVDGVLALADVPSASYVLDWHGEQYNVMFRHEEPPACDFKLLAPSVPVDSTDYLTGTIKLFTI